MHDSAVGPTEPLESIPRHVDRSRVSATVIWVTIVSAVSLALGLFRLGKPSFWLDETFTARAIDYPYPDILLQYHWVFYSVEKPWAAIAGTSEWALRVPAVVAAMLACAALVVLAARLFDRWIALLSGLFLATSPFFVKWSQQARGYTLLVAASIVAALLLLRALDRGTAGAWLGYGAGLSLVLMIQPIGGLALVPAHAVLIAQRRQRLSRDALLAGFPIVLFGLTWAGVVAVYATGDPFTNPLRFPSAETVVRALADNSGIAGLGALLAIGGLWSLRRAGRSDTALWLGTWAFVPFLVTLGASIAKPMFLDRYVIVTAPAFALLAAVAVRNLAPRLRAPLALVVATATAVGIVHWYAQGADGRNWHGEGWRPALELIYEQRSHDDPVLVIPHFAHAAPRYYDARWVTVAPDSDSVWALYWSERGHELSARSRRALHLDTHRLVESITFGWRLAAQHWVRRQVGSGSR